MGLIFSRFNKKIAPEQYPVQHIHHPSTVSYDFESVKGQMRALKAFDKIEEKKEEKKRIIPKVRFEIAPNKIKRKLKCRY